MEMVESTCKTGSKQVTRLWRRTWPFGRLPLRPSQPKQGPLLLSVFLEIRDNNVVRCVCVCVAIVSTLFSTSLLSLLPNLPIHYLLLPFPSLARLLSPLQTNNTNTHRHTFAHRRRSRHTPHTQPRHSKPEPGHSRRNIPGISKLQDIQPGYGKEGNQRKSRPARSPHFSARCIARFARS